MSAWRLEWLRLVRTRRLVVLAALFLLLGFGMPVLQKYLGELIEGTAAGGIRIEIPEATPADAIGAYSDNVRQLGVIVVVVLAAATLCVDARPQLAVFYRTRVRDVRELLVPRFVVITVASVGWYLLGALAAWYETVVLIGAPAVGGLLLHLAFTALYLGFAVAVTLLASAFVRGVLATIGCALVLLIAVLPLLGGLSAVRPWLPSTLADSAKELIGGAAGTGDLRTALIVTVCAIPALVAVSLWRLRYR